MPEDVRDAGPVTNKTESDKSGCLLLFVLLLIAILCLS